MGSNSASLSLSFPTRLTLQNHFPWVFAGMAPPSVHPTYPDTPSRPYHTSPLC